MTRWKFAISEIMDNKHPVYYFNATDVRNMLSNKFKIEKIRCTNIFRCLKPLINLIPFNERIIKNIAIIELKLDYMELMKSNIKEYIKKKWLFLLIVILLILLNYFLWSVVFPGGEEVKTVTELF